MNARRKTVRIPTQPALPLPPDAPDDEVERLADDFLRVAAFLPWLIGDAMSRLPVDARNRLIDNHPAIETTELARWTALAERFAADRRNADAPWLWHEAVRKLAPPLDTATLDAAEAEDVTLAALRSRVNRWLNAAHPQHVQD